MDARKKYITKMIIGCGLAFLLVLWMIHSSKAAPQAEGNPYRVEEFSVNTPAKLEVKTSGGHITVEASKTDRVQVEMYVSKNGHTLSPSDTNLDNFDIKIEQHGNQVSAIAKQKDRGWKFWKNNNIAISFVVHTPHDISSNLKTSGGHIKAIGLKGNQQIATSGGHLELGHLKGDIQARTSGGHIKIENITGQLNARTSGGHIEARNTKGTLLLRTSGGHIDLENIAGSVEARTSGGSITADIVKMGKFARLKTSGGSINITVPDGAGMNLNLHGTRVYANLNDFSGNTKDNDIKGTINSGGVELSARTSGGSVHLSFQ